jgi:adenylate kinase family enzyme
MRVAIIGNSGSGKSTLARWLAESSGCPSLDLDTVAWEPGPAAVARPEPQARVEVRHFCRNHGTWVVEGCYANLVDAALAERPHLIFLHPGEQACLANCRARPWEPHKYASKAEQDANLAPLLAWVCEYYTRDGPLSLAAHAALFEGYAGPKLELVALPDLCAPQPDLLAWVR